MFKEGNISSIWFNQANNVVVSNIKPVLFLTDYPYGFLATVIIMSLLNF